MILTSGTTNTIRTGALPACHHSARLTSVLASCTGSFLLTEAALGYATLLTSATRQKDEYILFLFFCVFLTGPLWRLCSFWITHCAQGDSASTELPLVKYLPWLNTSLFGRRGGRFQTNYLECMLQKERVFFRQERAGGKEHKPQPYLC